MKIKVDYEKSRAYNILFDVKLDYGNFLYPD